MFTSVITRLFVLSTTLADFSGLWHYWDSRNAFCVIHGWSALRRADHGRNLEVRSGSMAFAVRERFAAQDARTDVPCLCCGADRRGRPQERSTHGGARR